MNDLIKSEWTKVIVLIFTLGVFYNKVETMQTSIDAAKEAHNARVHVIDQRLNKKIKEIKELEKRVRELEKCK